jgi:hypothetical protein
MECVAMIAGSAMIIFAVFAQIQDLNPFLWGLLALIVYAGPPAYLILVQEAGLMDAPWVWLSSFGGLAVLFIVQSVAAAVKRRRNR